ncbi:CHASE3 domain-containing protein [Archangium violaceum]|uniref:ATP-binding protein n=1 Tax=Archangium violaceum TaxID=83451 RepID=UPI00194EC748|nr:ATP-binding protein [Archangium violaceum]QRN95655.1 CHASE3 domain-containing protein [Archangium violaceum]
MTLRARTRALLLASSAIYVIVGVISLRSAQQWLDGERWVRHTHEVLGGLQEVRVGVNQAESMTRGFVITGSDEFLDGFADIGQRVPRQLDSVAHLTEDNPVQQEHVNHLRRLILRRMQLLGSAVETRERQGPMNGTLSPILLAGHATMDEISRAIQAMSAEENRLLAVRSERARATARFTIAAISTGIVATLLLFFLSKQVLTQTLNRPVDLLLEGVGQFSAGALGFRIPLPPGDELGRIAAALNQMAQTRDAVETELKKTSGLLDSIISAMPLAVLGLDGRGRVTTWNPAATHLFGWTSSEVLGSPPPIALRSQHGGPDPQQVVEMECTRRDGSRVETRVITSELVAGRDPTGTLAIIEDITQRKEMERERERLLESSRRLAHRLEAIVHASIAIGDEVSRPGGASRVLQCIAEWARKLTGADYAALGIGTEASKPFHPWVFSGMDPDMVMRLGHSPRPLGLLGWVARQGQAMRVEDVRKSPLFQGLPNGHPEMGPFLGIPVRYEARSVGNLYLANKVGRAAFTEEDQRIIELLAAYAGVIIENSKLHRGLETERNRLRFLSQASESLVRSLDDEELVRLIVELLVPELAEMASVDLLVEDAEGQWVVRAAERVPGGPTWRGASQRIRFEIGSRHPVLRVIHSREPLVLKEEVTLGLTTLDEDGAAALPLAREAMIIPLNVGEQTLGALTVASARAGRYTDEDLALARDLALRAAISLDHARLYREAQQALRSREEVLAVVSHDLRNPLNALALSTRLLPRVRDNEALFTRHVAVVRGTVNQMSLLIEDLLNAGAIEAGRLSLQRMPHELADCLLETVEMLRPVALEKEQHLELQLDPGLPLLMYDLPRMKQVVSNLVGNAIKYTGSHGTIQVSARRVREELVVCVQDTGPGIAAEDLPHLFDRYWRVRGAAQSGTGLGLYIVKGIIEAHGGRTWVESEVGRGSRFYFSLPLSQPPAGRELPT